MSPRINRLLFFCVVTLAGLLAVTYFLIQYSLIKLQVEDLSYRNDFAVLQCFNKSCKNGYFIAFELDTSTPLGTKLVVSSLKQKSADHFTKLMAKFPQLAFPEGIIQVEHLGSCNHIIRDAPETITEFTVSLSAESDREGSQVQGIKEETSPSCQFRINVLQSSQNASLVKYYFDLILWWMVANL